MKKNQSQHELPGTNLRSRREIIVSNLHLEFNVLSI